MSALLPWQDVCIDVTGPFTREEGGERYALSCLCSKLRVPKLAVLLRLKHGYFSRSLLDCVFRARRPPDVRGPKMVNLIMREIMAIMSIRKVTGASFTPRHQGKVERSHQVLMRNHLILMHKVTNAFPQEWPALVPALEYFYATTPPGRYGLSAEDMSCRYAMAASRELLLKPFHVPDGMAETDTAETLFKQFKQLYLIFSSWL